MSALQAETAGRHPFTIDPVRRIDKEFHDAFTADFHWGVATSAYQIEGAVNEDGRGPSIWDTFCRTPGKIQGGDSGEVACDHYHHYRADVRLMRELGIRHYRFSVAWPRILPAGTGAVNPRGLAFYDRLVDQLLGSGITPLVTLYHWDLPQALEDRGGWLSRETVHAFSEYASILVRHLGDRVSAWITHNEPWCTAVLGYGTGEHAPGIHDRASALRAGHHALLSHGFAAAALRAGGAQRVGITLNLHHWYPATDSEADLGAAGLLDTSQNRWFLEPVLAGRYPASIAAQLEPLDTVRPEDLPVIASPIDFLGVNYYHAGVVESDPTATPMPVRDVTPRHRVTEMGWPVIPGGLRDLLLRLHRDYGPLPLLVTENGAAYADHVEGAAVHDAERVAYLREHLLAMAEAARAGVDIQGYYLWSLMDNFEWNAGYQKRFGIIYTDPGDAVRVAKDSAYFYSRIARRMPE